MVVGAAAAPASIIDSSTTVPPRPPRQRQRSSSSTLAALLNAVACCLAACAVVGRVSAFAPPFAPSSSSSLRALPSFQPVALRSRAAPAAARPTLDRRGGGQQQGWPLRFKEGQQQEQDGAQQTPEEEQQLSPALRRRAGDGLADYRTLPLGGEEGASAGKMEETGPGGDMPAGSGGNNTPSANPGSSLSSGVRKRLQYTRSSSSASSGGSRAERGVGGGGMGLSSSLGRGGSRSSSSGSLGGAEEDDVELDEIAMASERRGGMSGGRIAGGDVGLEEGGGLALRELEATAAAGGPGAGNATLAGAGAGGAAAGRKRYYFDNDTVAKQLKLFWNMAVPYFKEERTAKLLLAAVIVLTLTSSGVSVWFSYIGRDFWTALSTKNEPEFYNMMRKFFGALVVGVPVNVMYKFYRQRLSLSWREWLTTRIMDLYYANRVYYTLEASKEIDNPDQRIAEDIRAFTRDSLEFFITALTSVIDLVAFSSILFKIYPQLFLAILAYATIGTLVTTTVGKRLVGLNFLQLQREAFFRYSLMRVRENSESIAFYGGETLELKEIGKRLTAALDNYRDVIATQRNLEFFTVAYRFLIQVIPGLVVAPLYFAGKVELGVVSQSYSAFNHILADLSLIVNQFESLSAFSAGIDRLAEFLEKIQAANRGRLGPPTHKGPRGGAPHQHGDGHERVDLGTTLSRPFIERIRAMQHLAAGERGNVTAALGGMGMGVGAGGVGGGEMGMMPRSDSPAPLLGRESSVDSVGGGSVVESIPLVRGTTSRGGGGDAGAGGGGGGSVEEERPTVAVTIRPGAALELERVSVTTPDYRRVLVRDLSLRLPPGGKLLIVGNSGTGKSSLLRVMAGLWGAGSGAIVRPSTAEMFFLPQRPYCTLGSLRDQLHYPQKPGAREHRHANEDAELVAILEAVNLGDLPVRLGNGSAVLGLDVEMDFSSILSLGEQQRLAFGRLVYNRPKLAILDEATSALDLASEAKMYSVLADIPDISYVSVGHRPSLLGFHDARLTLTGGGYHLDQLPPSSVGAMEGGRVNLNGTVV